MKIVFLDRETLPPQTKLRSLNFPHDLVLYQRTPIDKVEERIADAEIVIVNKVKVPASAIRKARHLRFIAVSATGTDNIDLAACRRNGIVVSNIRNYARNTVPEHTLGLIFSLRRSICAYRDAVRLGRWQKAEQFCFFDYPIRDLAGSSLGIIGAGTLGQAVAALGRALGMRVLFAGHKGGTDQGGIYTPFEQVLRQSDILTLHCPLNENTRNLIGPREFAMMACKPLFINTARGGLVEESAVGPALDAGHIAGAAFDVVSEEPPTPRHPFMALLDRCCTTQRRFASRARAIDRRTRSRSEGPVSSRVDGLREIRAPVETHQQFQTGQIPACSPRRPQCRCSFDKCWHQHHHGHGFNAEVPDIPAQERLYLIYLAINDAEEDATKSLAVQNLHALLRFAKET